MTCIGAGFIGLEVAAELRMLGLEVTLVDDRDLPLERVLGTEIAQWLVGLHRDQGVRFHLGTTVTAVEETPTGHLLRTADGETLPAEVVLAGLGSVPNTEWLIGSGVDLAHGVVVDPAGRTNVPGVWAAGDVATLVDANGSSHRFEHWTHAIEQGRHVGLNIAREDQAPFAGVPYFWTEAYGHTLHVLGAHRPGDAVSVIEGSLASGQFVAVHGIDDELHAVTVSGHPMVLRTYKRYLRAGASLSDVLSAARS